MAESRYINPYTDFGFKKLFGTELNKDLLISFLNALFSKSKKIVVDEIVDVQYLNSEQLGRSEYDRKAVYDVYCKTKNGAKFIVEMQNAFQQFFKDRSVYYASFPIRDMAKKDSKDQKWNFELQPIFTVGILNFVFKDDISTDEYGKITDAVIKEESDDEFRHDVMLVDVNNDNKVFYHKLGFVYLEMPKFRKTIEQCQSFYDKWMFVLRNLSSLMERPKELQERIFQKVFEQAEIARYTPEEHFAYEESLKNMRDIDSVIISAEKEGVRRGRAEGLAEGLQQGEKIGRAEGAKSASIAIARSLKSSGVDINLIAQSTGLTIDEIQKL